VRADSKDTLYKHHADFAGECDRRGLERPILVPELELGKQIFLVSGEQWDLLNRIYGIGPALGCLCVQSADKGDGATPS
jgi:hypothetical protein